MSTLHLLLNGFEVDLTGVDEFHPYMLVEREPCRRGLRRYEAVDEDGGMVMLMRRATLESFQVRLEIPLERTLRTDDGKPSLSRSRTQALAQVIRAERA